MGNAKLAIAVLLGLVGLLASIASVFFGFSFLAVLLIRGLTL